MTDAMSKLDVLLKNKHANVGKISDWTNSTVDRVVDILEGNGEQWNRAGNRYRDHTAGAKYHVKKD